MHAHSLFSSLTVIGLMLVGLNAQAANGSEVYNQTCAMCHAAGLANAPRFGNKEDWAPRIANGKAALLKSALNGKNAMPARGGNPKLSDDEVSAAVDFMVASASK